MLLTNRKGDVDRNIRDLGVLPEEAFGKYIKEKLDKVLILLEYARLRLTRLPNVACQEVAES